MALLIVVCAGPGLGFRRRIPTDAERDRAVVDGKILEGLGRDNDIDRGCLAAVTSGLPGATSVLLRAFGAGLSQTLVQAA